MDTDEKYAASMGMPHDEPSTAHDRSFLRVCVERDALRARVAQLEATVRGVLDAVDEHADLDRLQWGEPIEVALLQARAALAANPDAAGRRTQDQRSLTDQLRDVERMAVSAGMYDAADWLRRFARLDAEGK